MDKPVAPVLFLKPTTSYVTEGQEISVSLSVFFNIENGTN